MALYHYREELLIFSSLLLWHLRLGIPVSNWSDCFWVSHLKHLSNLIQVGERPCQISGGFPSCFQVYWFYLTMNSRGFSLFVHPGFSISLQAFAPFLLWGYLSALNRFCVLGQLIQMQLQLSFPRCSLRRLNFACFEAIAQRFGYLSQQKCSPSFLWWHSRRPLSLFHPFWQCV